MKVMRGGRFATERIDADLGEVVRKAPVALLLKVAGAVLAFGVNIALARFLGPSGAGAFYIATAAMALGAVAGRVGLDFASLRFTASHAATEEWDRVGGVYRTSLRIATTASAIVSIGLYVAAPALARGAFSDPSLTSPLRMAAVGIVPLSIVMLHAAMLKGLRRVRDAVVVESVAMSALTLPLIAVAGRSALSAVAASVVAAFVAALAGAVIWRRVTPMLRDAKSAFDTRELLATSLPLLLAAAMTLVLHYADAIMVGLFATKHDVGIYVMALRAASVSGFILIAINQIAPAKFAALWATGDLKALERLARNVAALTLIVGVPLLLPFIIAPRWILGIFGPEFRGGSTALAIIALGQLVNMATGSVGYLLIMTGHQKTMRNNMILAAVFFVAVNAALIPWLGINGAAISFAVTTDLMMLSQVYLVYRKLSIIVLPIPHRLATRLQLQRFPTPDAGRAEA